MIEKQSPRQSPKGSKVFKKDIERSPGKEDESKSHVSKGHFELDKAVIAHQDIELVEQNQDDSKMIEQEYAEDMKANKSNVQQKLASKVEESNQMEFN